MNSVTMTIINPRKEYWLSQESNQGPPVPEKSGLLIMCSLFHANPLITNNEREVFGTNSFLLCKDRNHRLALF